MNELFYNALVHAIGVLIETNQELQRHSEIVAQRAENLRGTLKGLLASTTKLADFAEFRAETPESEITGE